MNYLTKTEFKTLMNNLTIKNCSYKPNTPFHYISKERVKKYEQMFKRIEPIVYNEETYSTYSKGGIQMFETHPLHFACLFYQDMIEPLLEAGNDPNIDMRFDLILNDLINEDDFELDIDFSIDYVYYIPMVQLLKWSKCDNMDKYIDILKKYGCDVDAKFEREYFEYSIDEDDDDEENLLYEKQHKELMDYLDNHIIKPKNKDDECFIEDNMNDYSEDEDSEDE